ncbi:alpha/beta hydrolase [Hyphomonas oceanitis]|uniref:alpha/beta hydrolase n=1 Tax=Hyphomonas oceanitis TaxID=81033 RepID=UPI0030028A3C
MVDFNRRQFAMLGGMTLLGTLAAGSIGACASAPEAIASNDLSMVDPELREAAGRILEMSSKGGGFSDATLQASRERGASFVRPFLPDVPVVERQVPGASGMPDVTVYVVNGGGEAARPAILHTHGGGHILGSAKGDVPYLQAMARELDCVVVTVEYRLAPETKYTGSVEDNYAGLLWLYKNADALGVDRSRIALLGESAGGTHAALLAIAARDRGEVPIVLQALIYPMLDDRTGSTRSVPHFIGAIGWDAKSNGYGWTSFLGQEAGSASVPAAGVPARIADLTGLPPAFISVGALDLFVSEDIQYANRLIDSGVPTELLVVPGAFHGFDRVGAEAAVSKRFDAAKMAAFRRAF